MFKDLLSIKKALKKKEYFYELNPIGNMRVPLRLFINEELLNLINDDSLFQAINVASLPGIISASIVMPDMHQGYGFPIGGVAAFDINKGIVSPGGIGFDINCGVRLLKTGLKITDLSAEKKELLINNLFEACPVGVGSESFLKLSDNDYEALLIEGASWAVKKGYGFEDDLLFCESNGFIKGGNPKYVSPRAKKRGRKQLGTVGAGNHFVELQVVDKVFDKKAAKIIGLEENDLTILIHCGSRGLGHQVCSDYIIKMEDSFKKLTNKNLDEIPDKNLIYAPINSDLGKEYLSAMVSAANYAFANRQLLTYKIREVFEKVFDTGISKEIKLIYDIAHNIAKFEEHTVNNQKKEVLVHRKGATRAFIKNHPEIPDLYKSIGQPIIIPGSMGTSSYLLLGTENAMKYSFGSAPHGAGRLLSRLKAKKELSYDNIFNNLNKQNIFVKSATKKGLLEEAPQSYKDIDIVIDAVVNNKIAQKLLQLKPLGVIKG